MFFESQISSLQIVLFVLLRGKGSFRKLSSCYNKCLKIFFNNRRCDSLTQILLNLGLPSLKIIIVNSSVVFSIQVAL